MATPIPPNRAEFSLAEVAAITGGVLRLGARDRICGVTTDSRRDCAGKLFVALPGERFDGHDFVDQAVAAGAAAVLVEREIGVPEAVAVVRVPDPLAALGALARRHRERWGGHVIAVGGAAGKTTTRAVIGALLGVTVGDRAASHRGNLNNLVGVPMILLALEAQQRLAVVEVGTNAAGEIPRLAQMVAPDLGLVTLIALEHTEGLGDLDAIEREEGALLASLPAAGAAVGNVDDERVRRQLGGSPAGRRWGYGVVAAADYRLVAREPAGPLCSRLTLARPTGAPLVTSTRLLGHPGALAVAAGVAAVETLLARPLSDTEVTAALADEAVQEPGRLLPFALADGTLVLDDAYNANPGSMMSSITTAVELARERGARLGLVLGEMRELGPIAAAQHRLLGASLAAAAPAWVVGIGGETRQLVAAAQLVGIRAEFAADAGAGTALARAAIRGGDVVLVKASRSVGAERVVAGLVEARGGAP